MSTNVVVKKSKIHGKGVFAARDFKKGEVVINWADCSETLAKKEMHALPAAKKKYVSYLGRGKYVLFKSPGKFVNHSCEANTKAINGRDVAVRNIRKGEEITANYIEEKGPGLSMRCNCGSKNCRGIITSESE